MITPAGALVLAHTREEGNPIMPVSADDLNGALTVKQLAERLGYSHRHTQRLIAAGEIEHLKMGGSGRGKVLVTPRQLADYLNKHNRKRTAGVP